MKAEGSLTAGNLGIHFLKNIVSMSEKDKRWIFWDYIYSVAKFQKKINQKGIKKVYQGVLVLVSFVE